MDDRPNLPEVRELLRIINAAMSGLLELKAVRTRNLPVGDIAELLVSVGLDLTLAEANQPGFDATDSSGNRYQIKGARSQKNSVRSGIIKEPYDFQFVVMMIFNDDYTIRSVVEITRDAFCKTKGLQVWSKRHHAYQLAWTKGITKKEGVKLDFTHFKRHKRGNLQYDGTEWRRVSVHRSWRSIVKNPPTPTTSGYAQR